MNAAKPSQAMTLLIVKSAFGPVPPVEVFTLNQASAAFIAFTEHNNLGGNEAGECLLKIGGKVVAHVSFNGRVWAGRRWFSGAKPIFEPGEGALCAS